MEVGNKKIGVIEHDYVLRGKNNKKNIGNNYVT